MMIRLAAGDAARMCTLETSKRDVMLEDIQAERRKKLEKIRELGIDPYGWRYDTAEPTESVSERYVEDEECQAGDIADRKSVV